MPLPAFGLGRRGREMFLDRGSAFVKSIVRTTELPEARHGRG